MKLSAIIPVKNGALTLEKCLASIREQTIKDIEIIVLDSMSVDSSKEIAQKYQARIISIPEGTFNHGETRNIGAKEAYGDFLFYTVQDAWLSEKDTLERMIQHFDDEKIMGVMGRQTVPHDKDKNPMLWRRQFEASVPYVKDIPANRNIEELSYAEQRLLIGWDNVIAAYRRSSLMEVPFVKTQFCEDWIWSRDALTKGWSIVNDPSIVVYHYHHSGYRYAYQLSYAINFHLYKFLHFKPTIPALILPMSRVIYHIGKHSDLGITEKLKWIFHNFASKLGDFNAHLNFLFYLKIGGIEAIENRYRKVCKQIPQGKQNPSPTALMK